MTIVTLPIPWLGRLLAKLTGRRAAIKGPLLALARWHARDAEALVVPERTSAALRWMGWRRQLIHFRHGAGDRAPRSEKRLAAFDLVFVAGPKDVERAVARGLDPSRLRQIGYVKLDYMLRRAPRAEPSFANGLRTILYNPHFDRTISSLGIAREIIARFRSEGRYNLIYAPHIRANENLTDEERNEWLELAVPGRIIIDLDSPRLLDMTYIREADLYLGDMSSQLYEFLTTPRPAAFINSHRVRWHDDPRYAGWHLGVVAEEVDEVMTAIDAAFAGHPGLIGQQEQAVALALGYPSGAIGRAAAVLMEELRG